MTNPTTNAFGPTATLPGLAAVAMADERERRRASADREYERVELTIYEAACATARTVLGLSAGELLDGSWKVNHPTDTEKHGSADAVVAAEPASVLLHFTPADDGLTTTPGTIDLVRECGHCGAERAVRVKSLAEFGELLATDSLESTP